jgi:hypothetical protein
VSVPDEAPDSAPLPPFPVLIAEPLDPWRWPALPFDWRHVPAPDIDVVQACRLETSPGTTVEGFIDGFDPRAGRLSLRTSFDGTALELPFSRFRRLLLNHPLRCLEPRAGLPAERVPAAAQEREYRLVTADSNEVLVGRTAGHVETDEGLFLFLPSDDQRQLVRAFVPRGAYTRCEFGPTAQDLAAEQWIATPRALLDAIDRKPRRPVLPIGQSLLDLGMATAEQLEHALAEPLGDLPLGERMVAMGVISNADLQTAIAHKMGYPYVDLSRFPIEHAAARKLPLHMAVAHRALPILLERDRLVVAIDRPARLAGLQSPFTLGAFKVMPVLAARSQILLALSSLSRQDLWSENVSIRAGFFASTR